jgi:hypothetical protein
VIGITPATMIARTRATREGLPYRGIDARSTIGDVLSGGPRLRAQIQVSRSPRLWVTRTAFRACPVSGLLQEGPAR